ncbi:hypothetical protein FACS1894137_07980 [Spirochaetia bacterium]|nr:hypothetical protein FACS1894137_07980 [Spirochaetia bacterium]
MKKIVFGSIAVLAAMLLIFGCGSSPAAGTTTVTINEADFQSDSSGILTINNFASVDVAVFAGRIDRGNFIGAIRARGTRTFDLNKVPNLPKSGSFLFRVASYETLSKKGKVGVTEEDVIYTGLVTYDLARPDRTFNQDIFRNIDDKEETFVYVANLSRYVVELRLNSPTGDKVGVLAPKQRDKKLWIKRQEDGLPYQFFPTYIYIDQNTGEIDAFTDKDNVEGPVFQPMPRSSTQIIYEFEDPNEQLGGKLYNVAFINLNNETMSFANPQTVHSAYLRNERGLLGTNRGDQDVYQIEAGTDPKGKLYTALGVQFDRKTDVNFNPTTVIPGHVYSVNLTQINGKYEYVWNDIGPKSATQNAELSLALE